LFPLYDSLTFSHMTCSFTALASLFSSLQTMFYF
jgi:hypothetical protein